jgi:WD40 repeat protein
MFQKWSLAALLVFLLGSPSWAWAGGDTDGADPLRPVPPIGQARVTDFRNYGMGSGSFALSPDGKTLAVAMHNQLVLFDLSSSTHASQGRNIGLNQMYFMDSAIAFSANGKLLAGIGAQHQEDQTVHFFDVQTGKGGRQLDNDQHFFSLAFSPDGKLLALGGQQQVEVWDAASGDEVRILAGDANDVQRALAFSPDGKMLATAGSGSVIQLWEIASGKERCRFEVEMELPENRRIYGPGGQFPIGALAFSRDGRLLAAGCADNTVRLWDVRTAQEQPPLSANLSVVCALTFTTDGKQLVSFDYDGLKVAWSVRSLIRPPVHKLPRLSDAEFEETWTDLADADASHVYRAIRYLAADPDRAMLLLNRHVHPVPPGDPKQLAQLVKDLQDPKGGVRRKAMAALRQGGEAALGALAQGTNQAPGNPMAMNMRVARFRGGPFQPNSAAGQVMRKLEEQCASPERSRSIRAVRVLEQIDNEQASVLLQKLSKGAAGARLTVAAEIALKRWTARRSGTAAAADASAGKAALGERELDSLWANLASPDAAAAFQAMRTMWLHPRQGVTLLQARLRPSTGPDPSQIPQLIKALDDNRFARREEAMRTLTQLGKLAESGLRQSLAQNPSAEARRRMEQLLDRLQRPAPDPEMLRALRAIEILEPMTDPEARQLLQKLAKGMLSAETTREARAALDRMR